MTGYELPIRVAVLLGILTIITMIMMKSKGEDIADSAIKAYDKYGKYKETDSFLAAYIRNLWGDFRSASTAESYTKDRVAWSAAFISYIMRLHNKNFPSNAAHTGYLKSIESNPDLGLRLYPITEPLKIGDVIVKGRNGNVIKYGEPYKGDSHGVIVVAINENNATVIGGNESDSIGKTNIPLLDGKVSATGWGVIARNV